MRLSPLLISLAFASVAQAAPPVCPQGASALDQIYPRCARQAVARYFPAFNDPERIPELARSADEFLREVRRISSGELCGTAWVSHPKPGEAYRAPDYRYRGHVRESLAELIQFIAEDYPRVLRGALTEGIPDSRKDAIGSDLRECSRREAGLHRLALQAADGVYQLKPPPAYEVRDKFTFDKTGVKAYLLFPVTAGDPPIIAFSGTENATDWGQNAKWSIEQLRNATQKFDEWLRLARSRPETRDILVTGHSLGGGLAQSALAMSKESNHDQVHLVTFNAFRAADEFHLFASREHRNSRGQAAKNLIPLVDAVHYRVDGDVVSLLGHSLGGQARTLYPPEAWEDDAGSWKSLPLLSNGQKALERHSLTYIHKLLAEDRDAILRSCPEERPSFSETLNFLGRGMAKASILTEALGDLGAVAKDIVLPRGGKHKFEDPALASRCEGGDSRECLEGGLQKIEAGKIDDGKAALGLLCRRKESEACTRLADLNLKLGRRLDAEQVLNRSCIDGHAASCFRLGEMFAEDRVNAMPAYETACALGDPRGCQKSGKRGPASPVKSPTVK